MTLDPDRLRRFVPMNGLHNRSLVSLASTAHLDTHRRDDRLFARGDRDRHAVYLLSGQVDLIDGEGRRRRVTANEDSGRFTLSNLNPRRFDAYVASDEAQILRVDGRLLERLTAWEQLAAQADPDEEQDLLGADPGPREWVLDLLQTPALFRLPIANVGAILNALEERRVEKGELVIRMGDPGDFYYLIREGECEVSRTQDGHRTVLATLGPGDAFGEEALLSDTPRNADVRMRTDGRLMRLGKAEFRSLLEQPLLRKVDIAQAAELVGRGAVRIDVRTEDEYRQWGVGDALNIPLYVLRLRMRQLDPKRRYIVYCDTGERSAAAAFLMTERGLKVYLLEGGLAAAKTG
ncbi:MAG: cyclic nucleotide-binding domain-containing protein [Chromatiales bacterium]|jgi:CRP-like cAMP-binding protein